MKIKEQLINEVSKVELAKELNISRQALYQRMKLEKNTDELYQAALKIKNKSINTKDVELIKELKEEKKENIKKQEEIRKLRKEINYYRSGLKYKLLEDEHKELMRKYINLRARYTNQNDELIRLKLEHPIERKKRGDKVDNIGN